jgi:hypothetical protein
MRFLGDEGLSEGPSIIDKKFRNDMGHLNFKIKDGAAFIEKDNAFATAFINLVKLTTSVQIIDDLLIKLDSEINLTSSVVDKDKDD